MAGIAAGLPKAAIICPGAPSSRRCAPRSELAARRLEFRGPGRRRGLRTGIAGRYRRRYWALHAAGAVAIHAGLGKAAVVFARGMQTVADDGGDAA